MHAKPDYEKIQELEIAVGFEPSPLEESPFPPGALVYRGSAPNLRTADAILKEMYTGAPGEVIRYNDENKH